MTLQQLRYIIQVAQSGSISMAAQKLFITQPSLSKAVSDLEKEMGITIFCRNNRGVWLSEEGRQFLAYARQVVEQADLLEQRYKENEPNWRKRKKEAQAVENEPTESFEQVRALCRIYLQRIYFKDRRLLTHRYRYRTLCNCQST